MNMEIQGTTKNQKFTKSQKNYLTKARKRLNFQNNLI